MSCIDDIRSTLTKCRTCDIERRNASRVSHLVYNAIGLARYENRSFVNSRQKVTVSVYIGVARFLAAEIHSYRRRVMSQF